MITSMRKALTAAAFAAVAIFGAAASAHATPITYVHTGSGSGTLDQVSFGALAPVAFTITATGDTANVQSCGVSCLFNDNLSASITIAGVGTFNFTTPTRFFAAATVVGFSRAGVLGLDLFNGPALAAWDMTSSVGPILGSGLLLQWGSSPVLTDGGTLFFNDGLSDATFTATVDAQVPEPMTLWLVAMALLLAFGIARRRINV